MSNDDIDGSDGVRRLRGIWDIMPLNSLHGMIVGDADFLAKWNQCNLDAPEGQVLKQI